MAQTSDSDYAPDEASFAKARRSAINHAVLEAHHDVKGEAEQKRVLQDSPSSQYYHLLREMAEAAQAFAISKQQTVDRFDFGILQDVIRVCESVHSAFHLPYLSAEAMNIPELRAAKSRDRPDLVWQHVNDLGHRAKIGDVPYLDKQILLWAVGQYLNLSIRSQSMDRILVDSLVAASILAFTRDNPLDIVVDISSLPKNFQGSIETWQRGVLIKNSFSRIAYTVLFLGGIATAAFYFASVEVYSLSKPAARAMAEWFSVDSWRLIGWSFVSISLLALAKVVRSCPYRKSYPDGQRPSSRISFLLNGPCPEIFRGAAGVVAQLAGSTRSRDPLPAAATHRPEAVEAGPTQAEGYRPFDLRLPLPPVPFPARRVDHLQARDPAALAPNWLSPILALEVAATAWPTYPIGRHP